MDVESRSGRRDTGHEVPGRSLLLIEGSGRVELSEPVGRNDRRETRQDLKWVQEMCGFHSMRLGAVRCESIVAGISVISEERTVIAREGVVVSSCEQGIHSLGGCGDERCRGDKDRCDERAVFHKFLSGNTLVRVFATSYSNNIFIIFCTGLRLISTFSRFEMKVVTAGNLVGVK